MIKTQISFPVLLVYKLFRVFLYIFIYVHYISVQTVGPNWMISFLREPIDIPV